MIGQKCKTGISMGENTMNNEKYINKANIEKIEWENSTLKVHFTSGKIVAYKNVPEGIYAGMIQSQSVGTYMRLYVVGKFSFVNEKQSDLNKQLKYLQHFKDTTIGLYATDRPDLIPMEYKDLFFEIKE